MTADEVERAMEFLLQHHARFMEEMDQLKDVQKQQSARRSVRHNVSRPFS